MPSGPHTTPTSRGIRQIVLLAFAATLLTAVPATGPAVAAAAQLLDVTTTSDVVDAGDSLLSLREATLAASAFAGTTTIRLAPDAEYVLTRCGPSIGDTGDTGDLDLSGGPGSTMEAVIDGRGASIDSACDARLLHAEAIERLDVRDLTLVGGFVTGVGGALFVHDVATTVLERTTVTATSTYTEGLCSVDCGAMAAVVATGTGRLALLDSMIVDNVATVLGCRARCTAIGGLWSTVATDIQRSLITGNSATISPLCSDSCSATGGLHVEGPGFTTVATTIARNTADAGTCTTCSATGGVATVAATTTMTNTTVDGNAAFSGSAAGGVLILLGSARLLSTTLADNTARDRSVEPSTTEPTDLVMTTRGTVELVGTIVAGRPDRSGCRSNRLQPRFLTSYSYDGGPGCGFSRDAGNIVGGGDPLLGPPIGALQVRVPAPGSRVLDAVPVAMCPAAFDAQQVPRPQAGGCDMGAVEVLAGPSVFRPLPPVRIFDSRPTEAASGPKGFVPAGGTVDVAVTGLGGVPSTGVSAVVLSVTVTASTTPGFVTVWPSGGNRPLASSINLTAESQTRAGLVTVPVGEGGRVSMFSSSGAHLLADVAGYYTTVPTPVNAGRIIALPPARVLDTRVLEEGPGPKGFVGNDPIAVTVAGRGGVPRTGATAVVLNLTATEAAAPGFVVAWPSDQARPVASVVNVNAPGDTAANLVMVPLAPDGTVSLAASGGAHLVADVMAYVTGPGTPVGIEGLFVPMPPVRLFDTRPGEPAAGPKGAIPPGGAVKVAAAGVVGVPPNASGVVVNVAATDVDGPGFVTIWPAGGARPLASTLNVGAGDVRSNAAIVPVGEGGGLELFSLAGAHLFADVAGYFLRAA